MGIFKSVKAKIAATVNGPTDVWQLYEQGKKYNDERSLKTKSERAHEYYEGQQWKGVNGSDTFPMLNIIRPTIDHKVGMICMNAVKVCIENDEQPEACGYVNDACNDLIDKLGINHTMWDVVTEAFIAGNGYLYFPDGTVCKQGEKVRRHRVYTQLVDSNNIVLGDEKEADLQRQPWIIIYERRRVREIRRIAAENGIDEDKLCLITADNDITEQVTTDVTQEKDSDGGYCGSLLYMEIIDGVLHCRRTTKLVEYQPDFAVKGEGAEHGLDIYPIVGYTVDRMHGSSRGSGEVQLMINNQREINTNIVRMSESIKATAFPKLVYAEDAVENTGDLNNAGAVIAIKGEQISNVKDLIGYLPPASMSGDAVTFNQLLGQQTKENMNAGDAVTGNINPEKASGSAIVAMRDQAEIPLNRYQAQYKRMWTDVAEVLLHFIIAYNPDGVRIDKAGKDAEEDGAVLISQKELSELDCNVTVQVSSVAPYSLYAREQALGALFSAGQITLEEYAEALPDGSSAPKAEILRILEKREKEQNLLASATAKMQAAEQQRTAGEIEGEVEAAPEQEEEQEPMPGESSAAAVLADSMEG